MGYYWTTSMMPLLLSILLIFSSSPFHVAESRLTSDHLRRLLSESGGGGTNWAVLVAGSNGYKNYRHQADICHAYQILKRGGLSDENIIVMMYDDIAYNSENPTQGVIINKPQGSDVYNGVPKDYTGNEVTASNLVAVILGDKTSVQGGSGKVVNSGPNDYIFIYYADHGSPGLVAMPVGPVLYANDFVGALKKKYDSGTYKRMVIYMEACESGSIFDGLLPEGMNIYVTTASNPSESSYATYCPGDPDLSQDYQTCLGDLYSVSWMEDSDEQNPQTETLEAQYQVVKERTSAKSHVMQYGDSQMGQDDLAVYIGASSNGQYDLSKTKQDVGRRPLLAVDQREADIAYLEEKVRRATEGSKEKVEAQQELKKALSHRKHVDQSVATIGQLLFGAKHGPNVLKMVRPSGQPLVDDWDCLKSLVGTYEKNCGSLATYGMKYMRAFANICNAGVAKDQMAQASSRACKT